MECNREEAFRAREIAAKKLENKDYLGARRIAFKAQRLFPELENIHQLLTVCEVHCSAVAKINEDLDWYSILQVESTADDMVIRKQYDKLAFWLQPDKNTLSGAEVALKLVSEAHAILCDRTKRSLYDIKSQYPSKHVINKATQLPNKTSANTSNADRCKLSPAFVLVFWTICPHCRRRFVYYKRNFLVSCDDCGKLFFAFKLHEQAVPSSFLSDSTNAVEVSPGKFSGQEHDITNRHAQYTNMYSTEGNISEPMLNTARIDAHKKRDDMVGCNEEDSHSETRVNIVQFSATNQPKSSAPVVYKVSVSNLSDHSDPNIISTQNLSSDDASLVPNISGCSSLQRLGKRKQDNGADCSHIIGSCNDKRQRKHVSPSSAYEQITDDNAVAVAAAAENHAIVDSQDGGIAIHEANQQSYNKASGTAPQNIGSHAIVYHCPDFFDFGKIRDVNKIAVDQTWALYDNLDGMPRFYAMVKHIDTSNLTIQLTWLEHNAQNEEEAKWADKELPVSHGNFCLGGETDVLKDPSMHLSHRVSSTKVKNGDSYEINPNKGEVWALYKGWNMQWSSDADNHQSYRYDIVEVLSDGSTSDDVTVSLLMRIDGFVSLFTKAKDKPFFSIPSSELLRFSHSIPFYRTNGNERVGIVEGLLELDTAALPSDLETFPSISLGSGMSSETVYTYPESEFHNFDQGRSCEKFDRGQIWALYNDADTFPNIYGLVSKVELQPFKVHLTWLEACCQQEQEKLLLGQHVPVSCGKFELRSWKAVYDGTLTFSHLVESCQIDTNWQVNILPKTGEVWAIYKNWSPDRVLSSNSHTNHCVEYAIGQIVKCRKRSILFSFLTKVDGYVAVFQHDILKGVLKIPMKENLRFSHRILSFRLTKEYGGKLRNFYELDPASVPEVFLQEGAP